MNILDKILLQLKNYLFPAYCAVCNCSLLNVNEIKYSLCAACRSSIVPVQGRTCIICGKPLISEEEACVPCRAPADPDRRRNPHGNYKYYFYDRLWVLFPYTGRYRKLLAAYKFRKNIVLADFFTEKIVNVINENPELQEAVIVPVPSRPGKIKENGWDQVDYLVKRLKKLCKDRSFSFCLKRRKSSIQKYLNRKDRLENLKDRIYVNKDASVISAGQKLPDKSFPVETALIIDDVITTGSTMEICAKALKETGVKRIYGLCIFYD
ncbi:MAG: double zinc ribbon domain-containing protein [Treponema sp.]|nr:double zinc ribbon domain-containing protein [Treponema sp.]